jgi:hypothetical protein
MAILLRQGFGEQDGEWRTSGFHVLLSGDLQQADGKKNVNSQANSGRAQRRFLSKRVRIGWQPPHGIAFGGKNRKPAKTLQ